jgi:serine/threonine protein kinase/tetratricopeptide (TPR) repeat protein
MKTANSVCERCGAKISPDATREVCPACLLETGLGLLEDESVAAPLAKDFGAGDLSAVALAKADDGVRAPDRKKVTQPARMLGDFGDYELLEEIGRGGQGVVYRAHQKSLNRIVALKVIGFGYWGTTEAHLKRFRREAEAAASLDHPCIVPIYEVGEREGSCYFSMKFVEGGQLDDVVKRTLIPIRRAVELIAKLARTVHYAHEHGILHRDIKPGNILLDTRGEPLLTDFGLARLGEAESTVTRTLDVLGTPSYMAPEQAAGETTRVNKATDIYGLGAVLYQLLTDHPPFAGGTSYETIRLLLDTEPRRPRLWNPKIGRDLSTICLKCLEKNPKRRYSSALALAEDLEHWLKHEPIRAHRTGIFGRGRKWVQRKPAIAALIASSIALAAALGWNVWKSELINGSPTKSVAVLPFENLSGNPDNAYFTDGVQDEILTDLARIADLKVISRSSVMQYKSGVARDLRKIGHQLGVANVVEGSVQRSGNRVRVHAQLTDVRTAGQLWAHTYDRDLTDVFAIQSEIAKTIASQLQAKLSEREKSAIERPPTSDIVAFDLYTRAENLLLASFSSAARAKLIQAADLLNQAIARDPSFFQAYCRLAYTHDRLYFAGFDHTPARLALAEAAVQAAFRLRPNAGETHLAHAENLYQGHLDYAGALAELELARPSLPNNPRVFALKGYIQRRQGHFEESTRDLERSIELDPRKLFTLQQIALSYGMLHRYAEDTSVLERALDVEPDDVNTKVALAAVQFHSKADTQPLHQAVDSIRATNPDALPNVANDWLSCALAERDVEAAKNALDAFGETRLTDYAVHLNRALMEGIIARMTNDDAKARAAFTTARAEQEKIVEAQPNYAPALCVLGLIDAGLGRKEEALLEGRRAVELLPVEKDAINGPLMVEYLAMIAAWVGDKDLACEQLAIAVRPAGTVSYGQLKLLPYWDPLRGDPRFEQIVASLAPK